MRWKIRHDGKKQQEFNISNAWIWEWYWWTGSHLWRVYLLWRRPTVTSRRARILSIEFKPLWFQAKMPQYRGTRDQQFIPPEKEKQKLSYDEDIKTFLQYFNKQREINLTEHAKRRYIHGTKNSSVYKRTWRHVLWQKIAKFSEECASPQSGQRKMETYGFSETFVTIYQSIQHDRLPRLDTVTGCSKH